MWGLPLNTSNIHRWYAIGKGLARFARFLGAAQPDARLPVVLGLPVIFEKSGHACMVDFPHQCAVLPDLLDGWCAHKKTGTYTKRYQPVCRLAAVSGTARLMPQLSEVVVWLALTFARSIAPGRQREVLDFNG